MTAPGPIIQVPLGRRAERRASDRFVAAMPMRVDGEDGTTRDLSAGGLSFVAERSHEIGARIEVVIEYILDGHHYPLRCEAEVVRVEARDGAFAIGAKLVAPPPAPEVPLGAPAAAARPLRSVD